MRFEKENGSFAAALKALEIGTGDLLTVSSDIKTLLFRMSTEYNVRGRSERNAALNELIGDPEKRRRFGNNGAAVIPQYSSEAIIRQYTDIYRHFLECCFGGKKG